MKKKTIYLAMLDDSGSTFSTPYASLAFETRQDAKKYVAEAIKAGSAFSGSVDKIELIPAQMIRVF